MPRCGITRRQVRAVNAHHAQHRGATEQRPWADGPPRPVASGVPAVVGVAPFFFTFFGPWVENCKPRRRPIPPSAGGRWGDGQHGSQAAQPAKRRPFGPVSPGIRGAARCRMVAPGFEPCFRGRSGARRLPYRTYRKLARAVCRKPHPLRGEVLRVRNASEASAGMLLA